MKIGFYSAWNLNPNRFIGDHLYAGYLCKNLLKFSEVRSAEVYAPNKLPTEKLDFMIYLNATLPVKEWAKKHVMYFQNAYNEEDIKKKLQELDSYDIDLYLFLSEKLRKIASNMGKNGKVLTFGAETSIFYPRKKESKYMFDVSYVGNDIKGKERTTEYILPATKFNFGLFGNWNYSKKDRLKYLFFFLPKYKRILKRFSRGTISKKDISKLYSSSKININCTSKDSVDGDSATARPFDIVACGGFLISDDIPCLRKILGNGAVYTSGGADLIKKIKYYLAHDKERKKISAEGYKRVIKRETVFKKAQMLVKYLKSL
jgi:spore maturation protein CgeB